MIFYRRHQRSIGSGVAWGGGMEAVAFYIPIRSLVLLVDICVIQCGHLKLFWCFKLMWPTAIQGNKLKDLVYTKFL